jgi:hypothetical protein
MQTLQNDMRPLRSDEMDAVTGGIINGCIRLPGIVINQPDPEKPFEDMFAKKLPSWVR